MHSLGINIGSSSIKATMLEGKEILWGEVVAHDGDIPGTLKRILAKKKLPKDPWGRSYVYNSPGEENRDYEITSYGSDGRPGGEGKNSDINSWELQ